MIIVNHLIFLCFRLLVCIIVLHRAVTRFVKYVGLFCIEEYWCCHHRYNMLAHLYALMSKCKSLKQYTDVYNEARKSTK